MEHILHDVRESWTEKEWQDYYQAMAEAEEEVEDEMYSDLIEEDLEL